MDLKSKIYVAGHNGMVGSAIVRKLQKEGFSNLLLIGSSHLDLRNQKSVDEFFNSEKPEYVVLAAAKVGGIKANNTLRADFIYDNIMIESNVIHAAQRNNVEKLLFLGSSCIYPKFAPQPIKEDYLLSGLLENTNQPYAVAKIAGIELCESYRSQYGCNFISAMPTNLYGTNDNYHPENSHVLPALIRKFVVAKRTEKEEVVIWGSGRPLREFLHVDDLADACLFLLQNYNQSGVINVGSGEELSISQLAECIGEIVSFDGLIKYDGSQPDGTPRKLLDSTKINRLGWKSKIPLREGIGRTIQEFESSNFPHNNFLL
jgi:GDP-L-fucose synthase